jgi:Ca2+-binding EF-hand superfamily protein
MISWGQNPTKQELQDMMAKADADGSGVIDFDEFKDLMKKQMQEAET